MAGTKIGGQRAAATNKLRHGDNFYREIGAKGGKLGRTGGFYANRELAREAGRKGGAISRRGEDKAPRKARSGSIDRKQWTGGRPKGLKQTAEAKAKISTSQKARWERRRLLNDDWGFLKDISGEPVMEPKLERKIWKIFRRHRGE